METENRHNCRVCGGFDFMKENGFFYCVECQTQCEDIREQVFDDPGDHHHDEELLLGTPFILKKAKRKSKKDKAKDKGEELTTWEMLNYALLGFVEELISSGAPESLRDTVLQMWAFYLQKLEVAFFSKDKFALPKLGKYCRTRDVTNVYGLQYKRTVKRPNLLNASIKADLNSTICDLPDDWVKQKIQKSIKRKAKKAFMGKVAELSIAENCDNESTLSSLDQSTVFDISAVDDSFSESSMPLPAEDESDTSSKFEFSKEELDNFAARSTQALAYNDPHNPSRNKLLSLLYLGLLYERSTIQLSDLLRWIREGHISYYEAAKHLPDNCFVKGFSHQLFLLDENVIIPYSGAIYLTNAMAKYLEVTDWPLPSASVIAKKYVTELQLPEIFTQLVEQFVALVPRAYTQVKVVGGSGTNVADYNYEGAILAIIVIILKLLFGLDGKTEYQISKKASQINMLLKQKKNTGTTKLFVWTDWVQQLICRKGVLTLYHFPTKQLLCPEAYGNPEAYINYWHNWSVDNAGFYDKYNKGDDRSLKVQYPALLNTLTSVLEKLQDTNSVRKNDIHFPQSYTPYSVYIQKIMEKSAQMDTPFISKPALDVLTQDFSKCDVMYLLRPKKWLAQLASDHGRQLELKNSAQKKFKTVWINKTKTNFNPNDFKNSMYVAVTNCGEKSDRMYRKQKLEGDISKMSEKRMKELKRLEEKRQKKVKRNESKKVKKRSRKRKDRKTQGNGNTKHSSLLSDASRKRKKRLPSGNSKKIKLSKLFKFYVPSSEYWFLDVARIVSDSEFEANVVSKFPFSFSWLLSECAFLSEMSKLDLYREVIRIEGCCHYS